LRLYQVISRRSYYNFSTDMKNIPKQYFLIGGVVLVIAVAGLIFMSKKGKPADKIPSASEMFSNQEEQVIPTVDSSVKVSLNPQNNNREMTIIINGIPSGTSSVDYELSYDTVSQGLQGIIGTITIGSSETTAKKKVTLGTCSSGTCVYHQVQGKVKVSLKFSGSYGERIFNKDFSLTE